MPHPQNPWGEFVALKSGSHAHTNGKTVHLLSQRSREGCLEHEGDSSEEARQDLGVMGASIVEEETESKRTNEQDSVGQS